MTENYFRSHFSSFQINMQFFFFFHKMAAGGHFGRPKITFDRIFRHFKSICNFCFFVFFVFCFTKWLPAAILEDRKSLSIAFLVISNQYAIYILLHKMAAGGHFGRPKITFDRISRHFTLIRNLYFFSQNGCRRPFWMTEDHFRSHFSPFQINIQLYFLEFVFKMAAGGHFGSPICTKNIRVLPLCAINGYAKYEVDR